MSLDAMYSVIVSQEVLSGNGSPVMMHPARSEDTGAIACLQTRLTISCGERSAVFAKNLKDTLISACLSLLVSACFWL